jgi:hypothetical protein
MGGRVTRAAPVLHDCGVESHTEEQQEPWVMVVSTELAGNR